jgi:hypothetical protein
MTPDSIAQQFRSTLESIRTQTAGTRRYPRTLKQAVTTSFAAGHSLGQLSRTLAIPDATLRKWVDVPPKPSSFVELHTPPSGLDSTSSREIVIETAHGIKIFIPLQ